MTIFLLSTALLTLDTTIIMVNPLNPLFTIFSSYIFCFVFTPPARLTPLSSDISRPSPDRTIPPSCPPPPAWSQPAPVPPPHTHTHTRLSPNSPSWEDSGPRQPKGSQSRLGQGASGPLLGSSMPDRSPDSSRRGAVEPGVSGRGMLRGCFWDLGPGVTWGSRGPGRYFLEK